MACYVGSSMILVVCKLVWNPSWFQLTTGFIWVQVWRFDHSGDCFRTCALINWSVLLQWTPCKISLRVICAFCNLFSYSLMYAGKGSLKKTINMCRTKKNLWKRSGWERRWEHHTGSHSYAKQKDKSTSPTLENTRSKMKKKKTTMCFDFCS